MHDGAEMGFDDIRNLCFFSDFVLEIDFQNEIADLQNEMTGMNFQNEHCFSICIERGRVSMHSRKQVTILA
jgi:hypothetical protein